MKHITKYKLFESKIDDIEDILLDISDKEYLYSITNKIFRGSDKSIRDSSLTNYSSKSVQDYIQIEIYGKKFDNYGYGIFSDITDDILRLYDYMMSNGYNLSSSSDEVLSSFLKNKKKVKGGLGFWLPRNESHSLLLKFNKSK